MIEKEKAIMITGGSSSAEAVAVQSLCQGHGRDLHVLPHAFHDTTGKDKKRYGFRHFFNAYMSGVGSAPFSPKPMARTARPTT